MKTRKKRRVGKLRAEYSYGIYNWCVHIQEYEFMMGWDFPDAESNPGFPKCIVTNLKSRAEAEEWACKTIAAIRLWQVSPYEPTDDRNFNFTLSEKDCCAS